ncbi:MAG: methyltransferase domain-containing protein [Sulfuricella sp.]|nr:methyltransferase domain-containing protein [Sulfuricella sp.]
MNPPQDPLEIGQFIPLHYHYNMLNDTARMTGFKAAIEHAVKPGARVLDLGGGTGVLSFFAAKNAAKVWCVEKNPELVREARRILPLNPYSERIEVVEADAFDYLPPEPVDVVICEMIHVAMLREKQIAVIASFKERYLRKFGTPLPIFVPEAMIQAVQPVEQRFDFAGYYAPTILFQHPTAIQPDTRELGEPAIYQMLCYDEALPESCAWDDVIITHSAGRMNALRFITKNILAIQVAEQSTIDWINQYLVLPLDNPLSVQAGDRIQVRFSYRPGDSFAELRPEVSRL